MFSIFVLMFNRLLPFVNGVRIRYLVLLMIGGCGDNTIPHTDRLSLDIPENRPASSSVQDLDMVPAELPTHGRKMHVGVLLPLSGPMAPMGKALMRGINMALFTLARERLSFTIRDTQGTAAGSLAAFESMVLEKPDVIVGPLLSSELKALKPVVLSKKIPIFSFSTDVRLAQRGAVFIMGIDAHDALHRMIDYSVSPNGGKLSRVIALIPHGTTGKAFGQTIQEAMKKHKAKLVDIIYYNNLKDDLQSILAVLKQKFVDGIIVPEGGKNLTILADAIAKHDVYGQLIGSCQWDRLDRDYAPALIKAWFSAAWSPKRDWFVKTYYDAYGQFPHRLASVGFDAIALMHSLVEYFYSNPLDVSPIVPKKGMERSDYFRGVDGDFYFTADGVCKRKFRMMEIHHDGLRPRDEFTNGAPHAY